MKQDIRPCSVRIAKHLALSPEAHWFGGLIKIPEIDYRVKVVQFCIEMRAELSLWQESTKKARNSLLTLALLLVAILLALIPDQALASSLAEENSSENFIHNPAPESPHLKSNDFDQRQQYQATCGSIVAKNHTQIVLKNPHHPDPTYVKAICEAVIERSNPSIKKLGVKFRQLELYRSNFDGSCVNDRFAIYTDLNAPLTPIICGNQTGQSVLVPFELPHASLIVSITTSDLNHDRIWHLDIEQS